MNPLFGQSLFVYIAISVPINAKIVVDLIYLDTNNFYTALGVIVSASQFLILFLIHFLVAKLNAELNKIAKMTLPILFIKKMPLLTDIKLNIFVQKYHTKQKYGVTYWKFGLISMASFIKVKQHLFFFSNKFIFSFL